MTYDIQSGTDEATGEKGTWIVRQHKHGWRKIAKFIPGEYDADDEAALGSVGDVIDALERLYDAHVGLNANGMVGAWSEALRALALAGRLP